jgi:hypothetical protein
MDAPVTFISILTSCSERAHSLNTRSPLIQQEREYESRPALKRSSWCCFWPHLPRRFQRDKYVWKQHSGRRELRHHGYLHAHD